MQDTRLPLVWVLDCHSVFPPKTPALRQALTDTTSELLVVVEAARAVVGVTTAEDATTDAIVKPGAGG
ncbi:hypothetical protein Mapa_005755 [Marchantia paleacea]|nr:hypothetical protein Mapa_005755 [Marchantia paleacea]